MGEENDEMAGQPNNSGPSPSKWGDNITSERKAWLEERLQAWEADHGEKHGPFDRLHGAGQLTGADVFWLAARSLAGGAEETAIVATQYSLWRARSDESLRYALKVPELRLEMADLTEAHMEKAVLAEAHLEGAILSRADLKGANFAHAHLKGATLIGTHLEETWLPNADCSYTVLTGCNLHKAFGFQANFVYANLDSGTLTNSVLYGAQLSNASLRWVNFDGASLSYADFTGADLSKGAFLGSDLSHAKLSGANLGEARFDTNSKLAHAEFDVRTCLADVIWGDAPLTRVSWDTILQLGDETLIKDSATALRAYRQLAIALRNQGLNEYADNYAYRAQLMQCKGFWSNKQWGGLVFSWFLFLVSGFGYRLWRILATYAVVVIFFSFIYWALGVHSFHHESAIQALWDSFLVSLSAIHGRTTFEQLGAWSPAAWTAAVESVLGIIVEGVFVAMLIQRFFAR